MVTHFADGAEHAFGCEEVGPGGERDRFGRGRWGGEPCDVSNGDPVVAVSGMHVPHAGPNGDLGAGADAGVLLEIGGPRDLEVYAEEVRLKRGAAGDGGLHI